MTNNDWQALGQGYWSCEKLRESSPAIQRESKNNPAKFHLEPICALGFFEWHRPNKKPAE